MTLTERIEFKNLRELQTLKENIFLKMQETYGKGVPYTLTQGDKNYFHLECGDLYTTGTEKDCYEELLEYLDKEQEEE